MSAIQFCYICISMEDIFEQNILSRISKNIENLFLFLESFISFSWKFLATHGSNKCWWKKTLLSHFDMRSWFQFHMDLTIIFYVASIAKIVWTAGTHLSKMWHKIIAGFSSENILKWMSYVKNQTMKRFKFETIFHSSYGKDV